MRFIVLSPLQLIKPVSEKVNSEVDKYYNDTFHNYNIYLKKMMHYIYTQIILRVLVLNSMHQRRTTVLIENFFFKKKRVRNTALTYKLKNIQHLFELMRDQTTREQIYLYRTCNN